MANASRQQTSLCNNLETAALSLYKAKDSNIKFRGRLIKGLSDDT